MKRLKDKVESLKKRMDELDGGGEEDNKEESMSPIRPKIHEIETPVMTSAKLPLMINE